MAKSIVGTFAILLVTVVSIGIGQAQGQGQGQGQGENSYQKAQDLPWYTAPAILQIRSVAVLNPGSDLKFLEPTATSTLLVLNGNLPNDGDYAVAPKDLAWWSLFSYEATGHIKDDEALDPDSLLATLKQQNVQQQEERHKAGLPELLLTGWSVPPRYDTVTHNLEWGTRLISQGQETINYTVRILGREGLISAVLVTDPVGFENDLKSFRSVLRRVNFVQGQRYSEFRQGDKLAAYGLGALVLGGAAAAAVSSGALKSFVKIIAIGALAAFGAIIGFFKRMFSKRKIGSNT